MWRPLYKTDGHLSARRAQEGHAGLWFDKFCDLWRVDGDSWTLRSADTNPKLDWIENVTERPVGSYIQLRESTMRLMRLIESRAGTLPYSQPNGASSPDSAGVIRSRTG